MNSIDSNAVAPKRTPTRWHPTKSPAWIENNAQRAIFDTDPGVEQEANTATEPRKRMRLRCRTRRSVRTRLRWHAGGAAPLWTRTRGGRRHGAARGAGRAGALTSRTRPRPPRRSPCRQEGCAPWPWRRVAAACRPSSGWAAASAAVRRSHRAAAAARDPSRPQRHSRWPRAPPARGTGTGSHPGCATPPVGAAGTAARTCTRRRATPYSSCFISVVRQQKVAASVPPNRSTTRQGPFWYSRCQRCTTWIRSNTRTMGVQFSGQLEHWMIRTASSYSS